jgi:hypothetical protein
MEARPMKMLLNSSVQQTFKAPVARLLVALMAKAMTLR